MNLNRRLPAGAALALATMGVAAPRAFAATPDETAVAKKVEAFRVVSVAKDAKAFDALCASQLSYSHSSAKLQDKAEFIAGATTGPSKILSLDYKNPTVRVVGDAAIVRFEYVSESEADGKKSNVDIAILMVWQKQGGLWKLLARSATKL